MVFPFFTKAQWTNIGPGGNALSGISFRTATDGWVCGANGTLLRTADGGATWATEPAFRSPSGGTRTRLLAVTTTSRYNVVVLGQQPESIKKCGAVASWVNLGNRNQR